MQVLVRPNYCCPECGIPLAADNSYSRYYPGSLSASYVCQTPKCKGDTHILLPLQYIDAEMVF